MSNATEGVRLSASSRVEAFSDAVLAIVITILVLDLRVPHYQPGHLLDALAGMWASLLAFLFSFLRVGVVWLNHHGFFSRVRRVTRPLLWMNLGILLTCAILPFPTAALADALPTGHMADLRAAVMLYILVGALQYAAWLPIAPYVRDHPELAEPGSDAGYFNAQRTRPRVGLGIDAIALLIAIVAPTIALGLWTLSLIFTGLTSDGIPRMRFPSRRRSHALKRNEHDDGRARHRPSTDRLAAMPRPRFSRRSRRYHRPIERPPALRKIELPSPRSDRRARRLMRCDRERKGAR